LRVQKPPESDGLIGIGFIDMLTNLKPWEPPSKEELTTLYASIGLSAPSDEEEPGGAAPDY
jgi:hypothetical protein